MPDPDIEISSITPVLAVVLPNNLLVAIFCIFAKVTAEAARSSVSTAPKASLLVVILASAIVAAPVFEIETSPLIVTAVATLLALPTKILPLVKLAPAPSSVLKVATPEPSVIKTCPAKPSTLG